MGNSLADVTLLLHPDFTEHVRPSMIDRVFGSLISGSWPHRAVDFLYLGWHHDGPVITDEGRVAGYVEANCDVAFDLGRSATCDGSPSHPLHPNSTFGKYNLALLQ